MSISILDNSVSNACFYLKKKYKHELNDLNKNEFYEKLLDFFEKEFNCTYTYTKSKFDTASFFEFKNDSDKTLFLLRYA